MPTIHKVIDIDAPVDRVFDVCDSPEAVALFAPGVVNVTEVRHSYGRVGDSFKAIYAVMRSDWIQGPAVVLSAVLLSLAALILAPQQLGADTPGGRSLMLGTSGDSVNLRWSPGTGQTGYRVQRFRPGTTDTAALPLAGPLPTSATSYTDSSAPPGPQCYVLLPLGTTPQAYSDLECVLIRSHSPSGAPQAFTIQLDQSRVARLSWAAPLEAGQSGYLFLALGQQPLLLNSAAMQQSVPITGPTCFVLGALRNDNRDLQGITDILCGVPGFSSLESGTGPSGVAMPTGDLPGWRQIFADDFTQDAPIGEFNELYGSRWVVYPDGWANTAGYEAASRYYPSRVVSAGNGMMQLNLHSENLTGAQLRLNGGHGVAGNYALDAAMQPALNGTPINQVYGKYTVRFRTDALPGFYAAWLLWPQSEEWPRDGEIDFPEGPLNGGICAFLHHRGATTGGDQDEFCPAQALFASGWHTASTEWGPTEVRFILDDVVIGTSIRRIPNTPMRYVLQTEACRFGCPAASGSGVVQIDWFVTYAYAP